VRRMICANGRYVNWLCQLRMGIASPGATGALGPIEVHRMPEVEIVTEADEGVLKTDAWNTLVDLIRSGRLAQP
jgi:hypothetical protein